MSLPRKKKRNGESFVRKKRKETAIVNAFLDNLFNDYVEVQQRYQDRKNGYLDKCPFLDHFFMVKNAQWTYFALLWNKNPKKALKLNIDGLYQRVQQFIDNQKQVAWMLHAINIFEMDHNFRKYDTAALMKMYQETSPIPEHAVQYMMDNLHWKIKLQRWLQNHWRAFVTRASIQMRDFSFIKPANAYA